MQLKQLQKETLKKFMLGSGCEPITLTIQMQCDYYKFKAMKAPIYSAIVANRELVTL